MERPVMIKHGSGLWILIVAVLGLFVSGTTWFLLPHQPLIWQISGGIGLTALAAYFFVEREFYKHVLSRRTTQYGLNSILMSLIAVGVVAMANVIASKYDIKKDLTKNKLHTLSDQSLKVVKGLQSPVVLKAFVKPNDVADFEKIFDKYTYYSDKLKAEFIDVDKDPLVVERYKIKSPGTVIIESESRTSRVENLWGPDDPKLEEKLTNAIIQVAKGEKRKIYFLTGHGERLTSDTGREGYSEIKEVLENGRYNTQELVLLDKDKIPDDAEIIICPGPKSDFMDHEIKILETWVRKGGKFLLMLEPNSSPTLQALVTKFGVNWKPKKTVLETNPLQQLAGGNPLAPIVASYTAGHEITQDAKQISLFPIATPVEKAAKIPEDLKVESLFSTSTRSLEVELQGDKVKVDQATGRKGPLSLAIATSGKVKTPKAETKLDQKDEAKKDEKQPEEEKKEPEFRVVVVGDSDFAANGVKRFGINADLFQNILSWLAKEEDLISVRPRPADTSEFEITEERFRVIYYASVLVMPPLMFLSAIAVWLFRKRK